MNLLYQAECSTTHFCDSDLEIHGFGGHEYVKMLQNVIRDESSSMK